MDALALTRAPLPQRRGMYTLPASTLRGLSPETLALLTQSGKGTQPAYNKPLAREREESPRSRRSWQMASKEKTLSAAIRPSKIRETLDENPISEIRKNGFNHLRGLIVEESKPSTKNELFWKRVKKTAKQINYAINYNGQKDASRKQNNVITRVAAIALPIIQTFVPELQIAISAYKTLYSGAQMLGFVDKDVVVTKEKTTNPIQSPLSRGILSVGIAVAVYFGSKIAVIVFAVMKIGLDILDLRNSIIENKGWTKEATLILIKTAGTVAYIALAIFDSNLALIFSIASKVAVNFFTAYCEASQGRYPEAIAAVVFGALTNLSSIQSVVQSAQNGTLLDHGSDAIKSTSTSGVTDMRPDEKDKVYKKLKTIRKTQEEKRKRDKEIEEEREKKAHKKRLAERAFIQIQAERIIEAEAV